MKKTELLTLLGAALFILAGFTLTACSQTQEATGGTPEIASLVADPVAIYPVTFSKITCSAITRNGDALSYEWVANDGSIMGTGPEVTWKAPKGYGDFHIMCTVTDSHGGVASKTVTVKVIVRDPTTPGCCR